MSDQASCIKTDSMVRHYRENGYVIRKGLFDSTRQSSWIAECERLWQVVKNDSRLNARKMARKHETLGHIIDRLDPVVDLSPIFHALAHEPALLKDIGYLFGEPAALFKDKLIAKPPGTHGYTIHQDYPYWETIGPPADEMLTAWIAIDAATIGNGALEVFPGLHHARIPGPAHAPLDVDESLMDTGKGCIIELQPGDVLYFHSLIPHRSAPNRSNVHRRALLFTYTPARYEGLYEKFYRKKVH